MLTLKHCLTGKSNTSKKSQIIKPHLKRVVDACHELGLIYQHHSCGYVEPILPDMAESGSYVIYPIGGAFDFIPAFLEEHFQYGMSFYSRENRHA